MNSLADIGLIGLGVMGQSLILNLHDKGFLVSCYNRHADGLHQFINTRAAGKSIQGFVDLPGFVASLSRPRKIILMIPAGKPVDQNIELLVPLLDPGDVIVDGGNSHYEDSNRRNAFLREKGLLFIGLGVSGGEEGALKGPSLMPGGNADAWPIVKPFLQKIAAKLPDGGVCCEWMGEGGAGHFVKMVHNGIEYGDMQLICEAFHLMQAGIGMNYDEMKKTFENWNRGDLSSYLIEITAEIMSVEDPQTGRPMLDVILDAAGQKGTGGWTAQIALDMGVAIPQIAEAVFARSLSAVKAQREKAAGKLGWQAPENRCDRQEMVKNLEKAVYAAKICSYAQGFSLLRAASDKFSWKLDYANIAQVWRAGCIIRAEFLTSIKKAFENDSNLENLLMADFVSEKIDVAAQNGWREILKFAIDQGIPVPSMSSALNYFDGYRCALLPANLLQAQRDYFGAHTFERVDRPRGEFFHHFWSGN
ncbi:MAG: decarboxylating NADP(+)-dependent phosphogluconate dehydrogenase [Candidatus Rifleibacteriota bacterium]